MHIELLDGWYVIFRGRGHCECGFAFWVDDDSACWRLRRFGDYATFATLAEAQEALRELHRRACLKRAQRLAVVTVRSEA